MKHKILIISGSTATGKSALALEVAKFVKSVIINADSIQLYKELSILSAQPDKNELSQNEHRLYSILNYQDNFNVNDWLDLAVKEIEDAFSQNKLPILVGGTGLYLSKLMDGINEIPEISAKNREFCLDLFQKSGKEGLISELEKLGDDDKKIKIMDKQRLLRRLEILKETGKTLSYWQEKPAKKFYDEEQFIHINLNPKREVIYDNCNKRFINMLDNGGIEEVQKIIDLNLDENIRNSLSKTIGFEEIKEHLLGNISKLELIEICQQKTRNYAKRQLTWFRNQFKNKTEIDNVSREIIEFIVEKVKS